MEFKEYIALAALGFTVLSFLYTRTTFSKGVQQSHIDELNIEMARLKSSTPSMTAFHALELAVTELRGEQKNVTGKIDALTQSVGRIERFLLDSMKGK